MEAPMTLLELEQVVSAVSDNPRFPVLAECPREAVVLIRLPYAGLHAMRLRSGSVAAWLRAERLRRHGITDWRLVRDPLAPVEVCEWCRQHVCRVCLGKHRHCQRRWMATMRPQWRRESARIRVSIRDGHTGHCAKRLVWGDGECECDNNKIRTPPGSLSARLIGVQP